MMGGYLWHFTTGKAHAKISCICIGKAETACIHKIKIIFISAEYFEPVYFFIPKFEKLDIFLA